MGAKKLLDDYLAEDVGVKEPLLVIGESLVVCRRNTYRCESRQQAEM